jgi:hypothetical protein
MKRTSRSGRRVKLLRQEVSVRIENRSYHQVRLA